MSATPLRDDDVRAFPATFAALREAIAQRFLGASDVVDTLLYGLLGGGHVLLEGAPGLGKTTLVQATAAAFDLSFGRIQFTPDLVPADIVGTRILEDDERGGRHFVFHRGPVFGHVILADEINRATPRTQSALLEAMQERQVTIFGERHELEDPFFVVATQNPIEMEGTFPLPEAQLDRFLFKILLVAPGMEALTRVLAATTGVAPASAPAAGKRLDRERLLALRALVREVPASSEIVALVARTILATDPAHASAPERVKRCVRYGSSPRGGQALLLGARARALSLGELHVRQQDIEALVAPALRHRFILNFEGEAERANTDELARECFARALRG